MNFEHVIVLFYVIGGNIIIIIIIIFLFWEKRLNFVYISVYCVGGGINTMMSISDGLGL